MKELCHFSHGKFDVVIQTNLGNVLGALVVEVSILYLHFFETIYTEKQTEGVTLELPPVFKAM